MFRGRKQFKKIIYELKILLDLLRNLLRPKKSMILKSGSMASGAGRVAATRPT
jgi:hypothetical protein